MQKQLRTELRKKRRQLGSRQQKQHQNAVIRHLLQSRLLLKARRIGIYLHTNGELATDKLLVKLLKYRKSCFVPVIYPGNINRFRFVPYHLGQRMQPNRFHIMEPVDRKQKISINSLDIIFLPLLGFDESGHRLGMGGGFYDRTLAVLNRQLHCYRPLLIGLAHECQQISPLTPKPWDIPLDAVITEKRMTFFK